MSFVGTTSPTEYKQFLDKSYSTYKRNPNNVSFIRVNVDPIAIKGYQHPPPRFPETDILFVCLFVCFLEGGFLSLVQLVRPNTNNF